MKRFLPVMLLAAAILAGCGKKDPASSSPTIAKPSAISVSDPANDAAAPATAQDAPTATAPDMSGMEIDPAVKAAIQKYIAKKGAPPRSWIDLTVEQGYLDRIPTGKDGKPLDFEKAMAKLKIQQP